MDVLTRFKSRIAAFVHDVIMIPFAWGGAYWMRFDLESIPSTFLDRGLLLLPLVVAIQAGVFWYFGLYRGIWRFASIPDFLRIAKAVLAGLVVCSIVIFLLTRMQYVPRSVLPLYAVLLIGFLSVPRLLYRWLKDRRLREAISRRTLIVGSGQGAEMLVRDLFRQQDHAYLPVAIVDDNPRRLGREIHGVRVVGTVDDIPALVRAKNIELVLIAIPSVTARQMRRVVEVCEDSRVSFRTLPPIQDLVSGQVVVNELREVSIEDLLGRDPVNLERDDVARSIRGQAVLVTGGAGSIGSELCRQIARLQPRELIIFDKSEYNLYCIENELAASFPAGNMTPRLGDVCDAVAVDHVFRTYRPHLTFHAAAFKHVPMLENQIREAVRNNVLGTGNVARAAMKHGCDEFVLISTDKAVKPANVMGASKRVAELLCQNANGQGRTRFLTVRFGNVLDSAGSVVPLFRQQIARGGPVTVTHPEITRYFMTISEACQLILQAAGLSSEGDIFVLDMGEPIRIRYLAEQMIRLSGKTPEVDVEIAYTGLRAGEKLYEELFNPEETLSATGHSKIRRAHHSNQDALALGRSLEQLERACAAYDAGTIEKILRTLIPEFRPGAAIDADSKVIPMHVKQL